MKCKICGNEADNPRYLVKEMMFGLREEFEYGECKSCGCLQLMTVPADMSKYYPADYYSFSQPQVFRKNHNDNVFFRFLRKVRSKYLLGQQNILGRLISKVKPAEQELLYYIKLLKKANAGLGSKILDVGCGKGRVIAELSWYGFRNLTGVDPYIDEDILANKYIRIYKSDIYSLKEEFDIILMYHSFEHMDQPEQVLSQINKLLQPQGHVILRIPTVSSYAWRHYGNNWVGIDAPRHLFIHSLESIQLLVSQTNFRIQEIIFDSTDYQFWASEQLQRDIPLLDERSFGVNPQKSIFTDQDMKDFNRKAKELNEQARGDQVCILLVKK